MSGILYPSILTEIPARARLWQFMFLFSVILGVLGRFIIDWYLEGGTLKWAQLVVGGILGILIFPQFYKTASFNKENPELVDLCLAFQNGFFWQSLMPIIEKAVTG